MIRFSCPRCKSILECPDQQAGDKIACPKCQQRLQIPLPPTNKTVLAPLVETVSSASLPIVPQSVLPSPPLQDVPVSPSEVPPLAPVATATPVQPSPPGRSQRFRRWHAWAICGLAGGILLILLMVVGLKTVLRDDGQISKGDLRLTLLAVGADGEWPGGGMSALFSLENTSDTRKVDFHSATDFLNPETLKKTQAEKDILALDLMAKIEIKDEYGNNYPDNNPLLLKFPYAAFGIEPERGRLGATGLRALYGHGQGFSLRPKEKVYFNVVAVRPVEKANRLDFAISLPTKSNRSLFSFSIPIKHGDKLLAWPMVDIKRGLFSMRIKPIYFREGARDEIERINAALKKSSGVEMFNPDSP